MGVWQRTPFIPHTMFIKRKPKIDIEAMANIRPTSKFDLKMQCIAIARGNVEEAEKLYSFLAGDINIPDVTPPTPSVMQQIKDTAGGILGFVKENQGDFIQAYNFIQAIRNNTPIATDTPQATTLPPLNPES